MLVAIDTETTGLNTWKGDRPFLVTLHFENGSKKAIRGVVDPFTRKVSWSKTKLALLQRILSNPHHRFVAHNIKFDRRMLQAIGLVLPSRIDDTYVAMHTLRGHERLGLKAVCKRYLGIGDDDETALQKATTSARRTGKKRGWLLAEDVEADYWMAPRAVCEEYALMDVERTLKLWQNIEPMLDEEDCRGVYERELALLKVTESLEARGMHVDLEVVDSEIDRYEKVMDSLNDRIEEGAWPGFCCTNTNDLRKLVYEQLGLVPTTFTETHLPSVDKDTLRDIDHPLIVDIRNWRAADSAVNKFLRPYKALAVEGVIHPDFQQNGPVTGRYSCKMPNLQNVSRGMQEDERVIPIEARKPFGPRLGYMWYAYDYSQVEARLLAVLSREPTLCEAFAAGKDVHLEMALRIWGDPTKRTLAKQIVYATIYGAGKGIISKKFNISLQAASNAIRQFHRAAPRIRAYSNELQEELSRVGYIRTLGGRKIYTDPARPYAVLDHKIQGTAADQTKIAMARVFAFLPSLPDAYLVSTVHDELIIETSVPFTPATHAEVKRLMGETWPEITIPLDVDVSLITKSWAKKEKLKC